jgi:1-acyl-sn-glycerol-3-phosphate acyltransferase
MNAALVTGIADSGSVEAGEARSQPGSAIPLAALRLFCVVFFSGIALLEMAVTLPLLRASKRRAARAAWLHRWCRFACQVLGLRLTITGAIPPSGLLVCNHLSYLDVIVLSALRPCVFVAKADVAGWPLFGWLARAAGTIFADRARRLAVAQSVREIRRAIDDGALVVLFPEGTSSDGADVLPFKSALLDPAVQIDCRTTAAAIDYRLSDGSVAEEVCYWRDMTLVPHLLNLFTKRRIEALVSVGTPESRTGNRKEVARRLRSEVCALLQQDDRKEAAA